jgi:hypothetical protein
VPSQRADLDRVRPAEQQVAAVLLATGQFRFPRSAPTTDRHTATAPPLVEGY